MAAVMTPEQQIAALEALISRFEADLTDLIDAICAGCGLRKPGRRRPIVSDSGVYTGYVCDACFDDQ